MNILENISGAENRDIVISLDRNKSWLEYLSCFIELKSRNENLEVLVGDLPKTAIGNKCFIIFDGILRGYMEIEKLRETEDNEICIELTPMLVSFPFKMKMPEIEGYKYFFDNTKMQ